MGEDGARARRETRASSAERASDGRGCQPAAGARPRRRLWTWRRHALARRAWLAGHGSSFLRSGTGGRAAKSPRLLGPRSQRASIGSSATSRPGRQSRGTRARGLLVRPRRRLRGRDGEADGQRRRAGGTLLLVGRRPIDPRTGSGHGRGMSGAGLSRRCGRCARCSDVGVGRRRGASTRRRRHGCRCRDPRAPPDRVLTVDVTHAGSVTLGSRASDTSRCRGRPGVQSRMFQSGVGSGARCGSKPGSAVSAPPSAPRTGGRRRRRAARRRATAPSLPSARGRDSRAAKSSPTV